MKTKRIKYVVFFVATIVMAMVFSISVSAVCNHSFNVISTYGNPSSNYSSPTQHITTVDAILECSKCGYQITNGTTSYYESHSIHYGTSSFEGHTGGTGLSGKDRYWYSGACDKCYHNGHLEAFVVCTGGGNCGMMSPFSTPHNPVFEN